MKDRAEIKQTAKALFHSRYGLCIAAFTVFTLITSTVSVIHDVADREQTIWRLIGWSLHVDRAGMLWLAIVSMLIALFIAPPMIVGYKSFCLRVWRGGHANVGGIFRDGFSESYGRNVGSIFMMNLFISLWSLLLIIPGIIAALSYFMTPYILAEYPRIGASEAIALSKRMTKGYKGEIFVAQLSFIGWWLLSLLTLGLAEMLYVGPYYETSMAGLYDELKRNAFESGKVSDNELPSNISM